MNDTKNQIADDCNDGSNTDSWVRFHFVIHGAFDDADLVTKQIGIQPDHVAPISVIEFNKKHGSKHPGLWAMREPIDLNIDAWYLSVNVRNLLKRMRPYKQSIINLIHQPDYKVQFEIELGVIYTEGCPPDTKILAADLAEIAEYGVDIEIYPY